MKLVVPSARIDDPLIVGLAIVLPGLFRENRMIGIGGVQRLDDGRFRRLVDFRHEVVMLLLADEEAVQVQRRAVDDLSRRRAALTAMLSIGCMSEIL